jgi:hypothetical protein
LQGLDHYFCRRTGVVADYPVCVRIAHDPGEDVDRGSAVSRKVERLLREVDDGFGTGDRLQQRDS